MNPKDESAGVPNTTPVEPAQEPNLEQPVSVAQNNNVVQPGLNAGAGNVPDTQTLQTLQTTQNLQNTQTLQNLQTSTQNFQQSAPSVKSAVASETIAASTPVASSMIAKPLGLKKFKKRLLYIAGGVFGVFVLVFAAQIIMKDDRVGKLVSAQVKGVSFMRPASWVEKTSSDGYTYYTEKGEDINNAELAVVLGTQTSPVDYATLSEADKARVKGAFTSRPQALSNSFTSKDCAEPGEVKNSEQQREGYDLAYLIEATCNKLQTKEAKGQVKIVFGWKGKDLQIFAVIADDKLWQQNQDKLEQILASAKPQ